MKLLNIFLSLNLIITTPVFAGEHLDRAKEQVKLSLDHANSFALNLLRSDIDKATMNVMKGLADSPNTAISKQNIIMMNTRLENGFNQISTLNANEIAQLEDEVKKVLTEYKRLVRNRFEVSFEPNKTRYKASMAAQKVKNILNDFINQCSTGRSSVHYNYDPAMLPNLPKPQVDFYIQYGSNGTQSTFRSGSSNSTGSGTLDNLNQATGVAGTTAGITTSIALNGSAGALTAYATTIAPYAIVAFVALAVITDFWAAEEQAKLQNDIANANEHLFLHSAKDKDVIHFYQKSCNSYSKLIKNILPALDTIENNPQQYARLLLENQKTKKERIQWERDSAEKKKVITQLKLLNSYKSGKCIHKRQLNSPQQDICFYDSENLFLNQFTSFKVSLEHLEDLEVKLEEDLKKYQKKYTDEQLITFVQSKIIDVLINVNQNIESEINTISWKKLNKAQEYAFRKVVQILSLLRASKNSTDDGIFIELQKQEEFLKIKAEYKKIIAQSLLLLRGRISHQQYFSQTQDYIQRAKDFIHDYYHVDAVSEFESLIINLEEINATL